ncbi:conserved Plasmodium protein, unknown function [Plasmodium knowlesi strain H]|uniref:Uncharacterized protein n=1 Tax=Plasmodium knowlesi (strain H) TaxID=5851 RepID=A0A1A7VPM4_PLAKH|nr:conserved Plasmodium protein, unknown function [Plasmodium knowlesi strain H]
MKQSLFYFFLLFFLSAAKSDDDEYSELDEYEVKNKFTVRVLRGSSFRCGLDLGDEAEIEMRTFLPIWLCPTENYSRRTQRHSLKCRTARNVRRRAKKSWHPRWWNRQGIL